MSHPTQRPRTVDRVLATLRHIQQSDKQSTIESEDCAVKNPPFIQYTENDLKWNGWGYEDTEFRLGDNGEVILAGNKYELSGKVRTKKIQKLKKKEKKIT